ncbi:hypothetical protein XthCFBP4691_01155 [Xanthomonas theicola]|uniref:Uncharacterized protein n=1 Tax=Xanthomonas theicola TaxID=56464 RepID=A0A2S6ZM43_9XANT|nr:hypothetical protein XthCFBP4691_01155 [Xanthomonas theicola]
MLTTSCGDEVAGWLVGVHVGEFEQVLGVHAFGSRGDQLGVLARDAVIGAARRQGGTVEGGGQTSGRGSTHTAARRIRASAVWFYDGCFWLLLIRVQKLCTLRGFFLHPWARQFAPLGVADCTL